MHYEANVFSAHVVQFALMPAQQETDWDLGRASSSRFNMAQGFLAPLTAACSLSVLDDECLLHGTQRMRARDAFARWSMPISKTIRCALLPLPLALVVAHGKMRRLMFPAHAFVYRPRLFLSE